MTEKYNENSSKRYSGTIKVIRDELKPYMNGLFDKYEEMVDDDSLFAIIITVAQNELILRSDLEKTTESDSFGNAVARALEDTINDSDLSTEKMIATGAKVIHNLSRLK